MVGASGFMSYLYWRTSRGDFLSLGLASLSRSFSAFTDIQFEVNLAEEMFMVFEGSLRRVGHVHKNAIADRSTCMGAQPIRSSLSVKHMIQRCDQINLQSTEYHPFALSGACFSISQTSPPPPCPRLPLSGN
jgi:hypothetical protein